MADATDGLPRLVQFYEQLRKPEDLKRLGTAYAPKARFKDPFNEVQGLPEIEAVFAPMFRTLSSPRFVVTSQMAQGDQAFLVWDFRFQFKGEPAMQTIRGASHLRFDAQGLVVDHRDYWDAAEELYEKLPVLGGAMRWLKRRARQG